MTSVETTSQAQLLEEDVTWAERDGSPLLARIYRPQDIDEHAPFAVNVHGGAWSAGDRTGGEVYCRALAEAGVVVASIDFRDGRTHRHPTASDDVAAALGWAHEYVTGLGISSRSVGVIGSSSGGHLALLAATAAHEELAAYVVALWPVSDPYYRHRYAKRAALERLAAGGEAYFGDEETMREASIPRLVVSGEARHLPPILLVQPGEDSNVPVEMTFDLLRAWQSRGGHIEYAYFPEMPHGFGQRESPETNDLVRLIRDFIARHSGEQREWASDYRHG